MMSRSCCVEWRFAALVAICLAISCLAVGGRQVAGEDRLAVDMTTKLGNHVQVPFFSADVTSIEPELKHLMVTDLEQVLQLVVKTLKGRLTSESSSYFDSMKGGLAWTKMLGQLTMMARAQEAKRPKSAKVSAETRRAFNKYMQAMFGRMLDQSKLEAKRLRGAPKEPAALANKIELYLSDLIETMQSSPAGVYIDLPRGTYNGRPFEQHMSQLMGELSHNGYGGVFKVLDTMMSLLVKLSSS